MAREVAEAAGETVPGHESCHEKVASAVSVRADLLTVCSSRSHTQAFTRASQSSNILHISLVWDTRPAMSTSGLRFCASRATRLANFAPTWTHYRSIHFRRELPYPIEEGLGDFLPPSALKTIAVDYQDGLLQRLNDEVKGTPLESSIICFPADSNYSGTPEENKTVVQTVINTATDRTRTTAFNLSSLALNNSFFLDSLVRCVFYPKVACIDDLDAETPSRRQERSS